MRYTIALFVFLLTVLFYEIFTMGSEVNNMRNATVINDLHGIAKRIDVFPVDLIARIGPLSHYTVNEVCPEIVRRQELTSDDFKHFVDFIVFAIQLDENDIDTCISGIEILSTKEQSLVLVAIYINSFPWDKETPKEADAMMYWSWLAMNYQYFDVYDRQKCNVTKRMYYKSILERYANSQGVAFPAITLDDNQKKENSQKYAQLLEELSSKRDTAEIASFSSAPYSRSKFFLWLKKKYPDDYTQLFSDWLYIYYPGDVAQPGSGLIPKSGNASAEPKTLGQIAEQLLESWDAPPAQSVHDYKKSLEAKKIDLR